MKESGRNGRSGGQICNDQGGGRKTGKRIISVFLRLCARVLLVVWLAVAHVLLAVAHVLSAVALCALACFAGGSGSANISFCLQGKNDSAGAEKAYTEGLEREPENAMLQISLFRVCRSFFRSVR